MKIKFILLLLVFILNDLSTAQNYFLSLPNEELQAALTTSNFPYMDAVIVVKEQGFMIEDEALFYLGVDFKELNETFSKALIVKLFNDKAVNKYKTFSFKYLDHFKSNYKNQFTAKARVLKPNGIIEKVNEKNIFIYDTLETPYSNTITRKVCFNIPNLAVEDILQIEYTYKSPFSNTPAEIFYYNDEYFTLYSNLYITLPTEENYKVVTFPPNQIDSPRVNIFNKKHGTGKTYVWAAKNLLPMPNEYCSVAFTDKAFFTAFYITKDGNTPEDDWKEISNEYIKKYMDEDEVWGSDIELLGMERDLLTPEMKNVEKLYTAIRNYFSLNKSNYVIPDIDNIDNILDSKTGDASELAYIFYRILKRWEVNPEIVFVRDKREGIYHNFIPALKWFDRIAINVKLNGEEKLFDFDKSLPHKWEPAWNLNGITLPFFNENSITHKNNSYPIVISGNSISEYHELTFDGNIINDSLSLIYKGSFAHKMRKSLYDKSANEINDVIKYVYSINSIKEAKSSYINSFKDEFDVKLNCIGESKYGYVVNDNSITITPNNYLIKDIREKFSDNRRYSDVIFDNPFEINYELVIPISGKFTYPEMENITKTGPVNSVFTITRELKNNNLVLKANMKFPETVIPLDKYKELLSFLDDSINEITRSIEIKKK